MYKKYFQKFIAQNPNTLHLAAHSHHYWPDVTRESVLQAWDDSAKFVDNKWQYWFTQIVPKTQKHISEILNFSRPEDIAFAPNVHSLLNRLLSCLDFSKNIRILTTNSEFHSFSRQIKRLQEEKLVHLDIIEVDSLNEFKNFDNQINFFLNEHFYDLIYISTGFFNSGLQITSEQIEKILPHVNKNSFLVLDGYHTFAAKSFDLSKIEDRVFFTAGGYKYAQAGEGICFLTLPKKCQLRPKDTGWFAHFAGLENNNQNKTEYTDNGMRFWGATQDMTAFYRFNATWDLFKREEITVKKIHSHVEDLLIKIIAGLPEFYSSKLICADPKLIGNFLTFKFDHAESCSEVLSKLKNQNIILDARADRLRLGVGLYHDHQDIDNLLKVLK